jgi:hypothetical protein
MTPTVAVAAAFVAALAPATDLTTKFWGIAPHVAELDLPKLKRTNDKAVVLLHGLMPRPLRPGLAEEADPHGWQKPASDLVKSLATDTDVFGFSYAQTVGVDAVVLSKGLRDGMATLKAAGYTQIVLVGHSAGGIIATRFVELNPNAGVTKVICVSSPYLGSDWANLPESVLPRTQQQFILSLSPDYRQAKAKGWDWEVPKEVQFCCVVCKMPRWGDDTVVALASQWPEPLQKQGVPAVLVGCNHFEAMKCDKGVKAINELVKGRVVRWTPEQTEQAQKALFGAKGK